MKQLHDNNLQELLRVRAPREQFVTQLESYFTNRTVTQFGPRSPNGVTGGLSCHNSTKLKQLEVLYSIRSRPSQLVLLLITVLRRDRGDDTDGCTNTIDVELCCFRD